MKRYTLLIFVFFVGMVLFAQSDELKLWTNMYNESGSAAGRLRVLQDAKASNMAEEGEFFSWALNNLLVEYPGLRRGRASDLAAADETARLIAGVLGDAKYTAAGPNLWRTVGASSNSLVKADALAALGKVGAADYLPHVAQLLTNLNSMPPPDRRLQIENGRIAFGAILALEQYKDISGYLPVFFAYNGWYDKRIRNQALASLNLIASDPTDPMLTVMKSAGYNAAIKYLALRNEESSQASAEAKSSVAVAALEEGWKAAANDIHQQNEIASMRKLAISMIRRYGAPDERMIYTLLGRSYDEGIDIQEKLDAIDALSALATENAAQILASKVEVISQKLNDSGRQGGGLTRQEEQLIRALIPALGATKTTGNEARLTLQSIANNNQGTSAVRRLAAKALKDLGW
ncbi:hypothetical protein FACS1894163_06360 [Spirochaetia bacterium]|nr:hypothetical protein FACS1894163_06360 [Spirochaetia bacterium]